MHSKQVDKTHYEFARYLGKKRWLSVWHQLDEVLALEPERVLEIGPGPGVFKAVASVFGVSVETLDLDPELGPDHVASATELPFGDDHYDVVCAFQMLEHLPFEESRKAFSEMSRVARRGVVISLPDAKRVWRYVFHVPKLGEQQLHVPRPSKGPREHEFDGEHYWEINKAGYDLITVIAALKEAGGVALDRSYRVEEFPYHRFLVFSC
ncbi:class I SAM-dependent methyltransferase [Arhodomonas sp. SL1]|uniref:class I SAM-dependent methyltransferase n=1 Tax=Arhodomonas sp. SL1 TaxID=3425691 RepID=UPI003F884388